MGALKGRYINKAAWSLIIAVWTAPLLADEQNFTFASAIPNDVLLFVNHRNNPEHAFIESYWAEVLDSLKDSGLGGDVMELIGSLLDERSRAELDRLKQRAVQLLAGVDSKQLGSGETAFAERFPPPIALAGEVHMGPPNMVWLLHGDEHGVAHNFDGLSAILQAIAEEVNGASHRELLTVKTGQRRGAHVVALDLLIAASESPSFSLSVARRGDVLLIALGDPLLDDVLALLNGDGGKSSLAEDPRFRSAFARLPAPEDTMTFFDMQSMLRSFRRLADEIAAAMKNPQDVYRNTRMEGEEKGPHNAALAAYRRGDIAEALRQTQEAHKLAPGNAIILYNLACFHALPGHREEALTWLEKAVEAGFHAPAKISSDSDLACLRDDPRYQSALDRATKLAQESAGEDVEDVMVNSSKSSEASKLCEQAVQAAHEPRPDHSHCLRLAEQAHQLAPNDSRVLYNLARFNALLGRHDKALNFLDQAVDGGFYCPDHISKDPDLEGIRNTDRFKAALSRAKLSAAQMATDDSTQTAALVKGLVDRLLDAVGILDYSASVCLTEGYSVHTHTVNALVPDAQQRPIYAVFGKREPLADFQRYLPKETLSFSVSSGIDPPALYAFLENALADTGPKGQELLARWNEIQSGFGLDLKRDVFGWIQGEIVTLTLEQSNAWVLLARVTDETAAQEKVAAALEFLSTRLNEAVAKAPPLAMLSVRRAPLLHQKLSGFESLTFAVAPMQPLVWGVADGRLILGSSAEAVAMCLQTAQGQHPDIRENPRFMAEALSPQGAVTSIQLTDHRNWPDYVASVLGFVSMGSGTASMFVTNQKARTVISKIAGMVGKLTPIVRKMDFYKSTASYTTREGNTWRTHAVTHYFSPAERASRQPAADPSKALNGL